MSATPSRAYTAARKISDIGNAMTYSIVLGILFSFLTPQVLNAWLVFLLSFLLMVFGPGAVLAYGIKTGKIDFDVTDQKVRTPYYLVIECFYVAGIFVFSSMAFPSWIMFCMAIVSVILNGLLFLVNLKWKISAHAAGAAGPATGIALVFGWWTLLVTVPTVIAVVWSRLYLKKHTPGQLVAGTMFAVAVYAAIFMLVYPLFLF
jgi:membrane-associated phospholipid phosphatase